MEFFLNKQQGKITNRQKVAEAFTSLKDGYYLVSIKLKNSRSLPQNAFYWAVVVPMVKKGFQDIGYNEVTSDNITHEILKAKFLRTEIGQETGYPVEVIRSTAELTTVEFMEYIANIQQFAAEFLNVIIPDPNQQLTIL
jgi:hypothetical protein